MSKKLFKVDLKDSVVTSVDASTRAALKTVKKSGKKMVENNLKYHPSRLSPLDYLVFKILHGQFGQKPYPVLPVAIGMVRKSLSQAKRLLSHGSL